MINFEKEVLPLKVQMERNAMRFVGYDEAQDIVQKSMIKIWKKCAELNDAEKLKRFVYIVVKNTALDHMKSQKKYKSIDEGEDYEDDGKDLDSFKFELTIKGLNDYDRTIISKYYEDGLNFREIGEDLGLPEKTVQDRHRKIISNMRGDVK